LISFPIEFGLIKEHVRKCVEKGQRKVCASQSVWFIKNKKIPSDCVCVQCQSLR
jgi:hypothetical protein